MEHRCGLRRPVAIKVRLRTQHGRSGDGEISDISASGALLRSDLTAALHSRLVVESVSAKHNRVKTEAPLTGEVVRHVSGGFALEWTEFSPEAVRALMREAVGATEVRRAEVMGSKSH